MREWKKRANEDDDQSNGLGQEAAKQPNYFGPRQYLRRPDKNRRI
jgi:hypothetical protein